MDEKLRRQMQTLDRLYKESDRIGDDYAAHFGMNNTAFWVLYTLSRTTCARSGFSRHRQ